MTEGRRDWWWCGGRAFSPHPLPGMGNLCDRPPPEKKNTAASSWRRSVSSLSVCSCSRDPAAVKVSALVRRCRRREGGNCANTVVFSRSTSHRYTTTAVTGSKKLKPLNRSSRQRSITDPLLAPQELVQKEIKVQEEEGDSGHFLLVHGGGMGAWCWYKTIALLEEGGFKVTVVDLTSSGIHSLDSNKVQNLAHYVHPLFHVLQNLPGPDKVIIVGHDLGGTCLSYAMEIFPSKISKAIFVAATMPADGQNTLELFPRQVEPNSRMFVYANGDDHPPTSIVLDKTLFRDLYFNHTPSKDVALANVSMRPIPFMPLSERVSLTSANFGSVRRFYIKTTEDKMFDGEMQERMIEANPPELVLYLKGSDHSPFFSKPLALNKLLLELAHTP